MHHRKNGKGINRQHRCNAENHQPCVHCPAYVLAVEICKHQHRKENHKIEFIDLLYLCLVYNAEVPDQYPDAHYYENGQHCLRCH